MNENSFSKTSLVEGKENNIWYSYGKLKIHAVFFEAGITLITPNFSGMRTAENKKTLVNTQRREEVFLSVIFEKQKQGTTEKIQEGIYVYPWLSLHDNSLKFNGFKQYVTAGCMFGPTLRCENQNGAKRPLILGKEINFQPPNQKNIMVSYYLRVGLFSNRDPSVRNEIAINIETNLNEIQIERRSIIKNENK